MSIAQRFGGWLRALAAADLVSDRAVENLRVGFGRSFTDDELDEALARFAYETSASMTSGAYQRWCDTTMAGENDTHLPGRGVIARRLGAWADAAARIQHHRSTPRASS